ncbi:hypothetical protein B0T17DRAFT_581504 [Bombardia bombarda]|uniref:Uncharacterized protein n=1 Tax=Bombardia bombarda TaxID=252184 RepID=A0AA40BVW2_9PEZI|nr:hypothetical protein B0T17DRAFT_581504 [Bombardia bombarda]
MAPDLQRSPRLSLRHHEREHRTTSPKKNWKHCIETKMTKITCNTRDSLVVADPTTSLALTCLSGAERTGCRVLKWV